MQNMLKLTIIMGLNISALSNPNSKAQDTIVIHFCSSLTYTQTTYSLLEHKAVKIIIMIIGTCMMKFKPFAGIQTP